MFGHHPFSHKSTLPSTCNFWSQRCPNSHHPSAAPVKCPPGSLFYLSNWMHQLRERGVRGLRESVCGCRGLIERFRIRYRKNQGNRGLDLIFKIKSSSRHRCKIIRILRRLRLVPLFPWFYLLRILSKRVGSAAAYTLPQAPDSPLPQRPPVQSK